MKKSERLTASSPTQPLQWLTAVFLLGLFLIFYTTLYPFDFIAAASQTWLDILASFNLNVLEELYIDDIPRNIVLFVPFGFAFGGLLAHKLRKNWLTGLLTLLAGLLLSFSVEVLQSYSLVRHPTLADVLANGLGAGIGFALYWAVGTQLVHWGMLVLGKIRPYLSIRSGVILFVFYAAFFIWLSILAQKQTQLSNWDTSYPLLIGNETTGNRVWRGYMTDLFIMDRALTADEVSALFHDVSAKQIGADHLVAYYDFVGDGADNFPPLQWEGTAVPTSSTDGIFLAKGQWLQSVEPATELSRALRDSSQFTLGTRFAVGRFDKGGPRRIVSISQGTGMRNLTLGQEKHDLVLRLRTPFSNLNGRIPELVIPNFFVDELYHNLIITYDGAQVIVYVDDLAQQYRIELAPAVVFFNTFPPQELDQMQLTDLNKFIFSVLYDALFFVPFAALLVFIYGRLSWQKWRKSLLIILLLIFISFVWEGVLSFFLVGYTITAENVGLNLALGLIALVLFALWQIAWAHSVKHA